jgi:putative hydrolase of the HAD superfamily
MGKIQAVIFDWGGVLIEDPAPKMIKYIAKALGVSEDRYKQASTTYMADFQTGRVTEQQFWAYITRHLGVPTPTADSLWGKTFADAYVPRPELFSLAARLRNAGSKTAILSNTEPPAVEFFHRQKHNMFDVAVFSCLEGTKKPERKIYEITLDRLRTPAKQTLFVDDTLDYIEAAKQLGLKTILFKNLQQFKKDLTKAFEGLDNGFGSII